MEPALAVGGRRGDRLLRGRHRARRSASPRPTPASPTATRSCASTAGCRPAQAQPKALEAVTRALALDPQLPEAHRAKGIYTFHFEPHWRAAEEAFVAALALDPHDAICDATYGMFLATAYRHDEARRAPDPGAGARSVLGAGALPGRLGGLRVVRRRRWPRATPPARSNCSPTRSGPRWPQTVALLMTGRHAEAIALGEQMRGAGPGAGVRRRHGAGAGPGRTSRRRPPPGRGTLRTGRPRRVRLAGRACWRWPSGWATTPWWSGASPPAPAAAPRRSRSSATTAGCSIRCAPARRRSIGCSTRSSTVRGRIDAMASADLA